MVKEVLEPQNSNATAIQWTVHPIKRNWKVSAGLGLFLVILCAAIYFSFSSATFLLLSVVILVSSLASFFFPTTYTLRDDCITVRSLLRRFSRQWGFFKSYYPDKNGVLLSPFSSPSRLENFRGVYIKFGHNRAEVVDFIKEKMENQSPGISQQSLGTEN
jgi:hypothetical protein